MTAVPRRRLSRTAARSLGLLGALATVASTTVACGGAEAAPAVMVFTPEIGDELAVIQRVLAAFGEREGITIEVQGTRDFEALVESQIAAGDPPDIALYPQPGAVQGLARDGELVPLPVEDAALVRSNVDPTLHELVTVDDRLWAVPVKADLKSLVWYSPATFAANGYEVPDTFDGFVALVREMAADGNPALCVGIRSGEASGWPLTDWIEDFLLREEGPELYDQWVRHEIPFDDARVVAVAQTVVDLWHQDRVIFGGPQAAAVTDFGDAVLPLVDGECMMHRGAAHLGVYWPRDVTFGPDGDVDAFRLPGSDENPGITLTGGQFAAAFDDRDDVRRVVSYLASDRFAEDTLRVAYDRDDPLATAGSFLSANRTVDLALYPEGLTRELGQALRDADPVRFDASDLMPSAVGSGTFWAAAVDLTLGSEDVATAFAEIEAAWPTD